MHFNGTNGSTTMTDNSKNNFVLTAINGASLSSVQSKFGGTSLALDGTNDYVSISGNNILDFASSDFTVECWVRLNAMPTSDAWPTNYSSHFIVITIGTPNLGDGIGFIIGQTKLIIQNNDGQSVNGTHGMTTNTWYHLAFVRYSNNLYLYVDGVQKGTAAYSSAVGTGATTYIGCETGQGAFLNGYIDDLRVTKGVARYTTNFTPPTTQFPDNTGLTQYATKYVGLIGGLNDRSVDYGVQKLSDSSLKLTRLTYPNQPIVGSGSLSGSVSRVYVNVLDYTKVSVTSSYARNALSASYLIPTSNNTTKAIFGYGYTSAAVSMVNLVSNIGVVANDVTGVGSARHTLAATGYGTDKAIFGYGFTSAVVSITNLVSNTGVVANDTTGVGTARDTLAATGYGTDKAIFGYGNTGVNVSMTNLVSNTGVVATDTTGVGTARSQLAAAGYGTDKAIFGYGTTGAVVSMTNLVSNTGVVATDTTGVGTARRALAAAGYGNNKAIFGYGYTTGNVSITNLVSNTGVVATDTTGVGTARHTLAAAGYGTDKAIFGYGYTNAAVSIVNLVSNTGVVANDTLGVGTARYWLAAAGYSTT